ncbi:MarR family winged helix-turn-helix transcriptional regulator [Sphingomonas koreensis]|jgi:DNA-binding MarR family transcriptional regulator|uniref:MarR family winged helix-turn-helix transcriptional regulator n=2 Tax=Sphingomonas TaxID=13687 RepID=UPI00234EC06E|nr:MarR family transcriptional regulator [Sphingomonas koreensis]MDC7812161.1 MarR family transcriptional regulator [Sphingomonas koreensis]
MLMMDEPSDRLINVFGALSQAVSDRVRIAIAEAFTAGGETAAALIAIGHEPGMSIDQISRILRLSHAGTVRVVERLDDQGLVGKSQSPSDRRVAHITLTRRGQAERTKLLGLRNAAVSGLLVRVPDNDRAVLERIADTILTSLLDDPQSALPTCRFCDQAKCLGCPMGARRH